jgi:hypothetical protein
VQIFFEQIPSSCELSLLKVGMGFIVILLEESCCICHILSCLGCSCGFIQTRIISAYKECNSETSYMYNSTCVFLSYRLKILSVTAVPIERFCRVGTVPY